MSSQDRYKILSIHWGFSLGGVAKYAALLEQVGAYQDLQIKSVCIHGEGWSLDTQTLSSLNADFITIKSRLDFSWFKKLVAHINVENPDAIITHGFNGHIIYRLASLFSGSSRLWLASYHGEYHGNSTIRRLVGVLFNYVTVYLFKHWVTGVISVADYSKQHLLKQGVKADNVSVIHNGIALLDINHQAGRALRDAWGVKSNELIFGVISRLDPVKGVEYLIDAFAKIKPKFPDVKFIVIGSGSMTDELKALVDKRGLAEVTHFIGYRSDVDECLAALDIFVLPSLAEYHSIALLEAMRAQKAIIATNVGGNTESVSHGEQAIVVPSADVGALSEALETLLSDQRLRAHLAKAAQQRFTHEFTSDLMIEQTADWLYHSINTHVL